MYEPSERLYNVLIARHSRLSACLFGRARRAAGATRDEPHAAPARTTHTVILEVLLTKELPMDVPDALARRVPREQWAKWMHALSAASDAANPLRKYASRFAPAWLAAIEQRVAKRYGAEAGARARALVVMAALALEALCYRPLLLPRALACWLNPLYLYHWWRTRHVVAQIGEELTLLGGRVVQRPGLLTFHCPRRVVAPTCVGGCANSNAARVVPQRSKKSTQCTAQTRDDEAVSESSESMASHIGIA